MNITDIENNLSTFYIDEEVWFVGKEVCDLIGINKTQLRRLDEDEKMLEKINSKGGNQNTTLINESGFYHLILTSNAPKAKDFRKLITRDFLPKVRKLYQYKPQNIANFIEEASGRRLLVFERSLINSLMMDINEDEKEIT